MEASWDDVRAGTAEPRPRVLALLRRYSWNATAFQVLERGFEYFFDGDDACVAYVDTGGAWVVAGAPIATPLRFEEVTARFLAAARAAGRRACFFAVERRFADAVGLPSLLVGEQASWDPGRWAAALAGRRSVREQLRRARAKGVRVRAVPPEEMAPSSATGRALTELVARWLGGRAMPRLRFLVDVQLFEHVDERRVFVAERDGAIVGLLAASPVFGRAGWLFEDLVRDPHAPNGTTETLIDAGMRAVADEGSRYVTLGLAPLSGPVRAPLRRVRRWSSSLYDFEGLRAFKAKLAPHAWEPILLAHAPGASPLVALYDVLRAFAGTSLLMFGVRAALRAPLHFARALARALGRRLGR